MRNGNSDHELAGGEVEAYARRKIREAGGRLLKWVSPGVCGVPDDICFWPYIGDHFIEFKAARERLTAGQKREIAWLESQGRLVFVIRSKRQVDSYVETWRPRRVLGVVA